MRVIHKINAFLLAMLLCAAPARADIERLSWLTGCWSQTGKEPGSIEQWTAPAGRSRLAMNRTVSNGKTVAFEFIRIVEHEDGSIIFIASPSGQETARFALSTISEREVIFDNPLHDFPQRIIYRLLDDDSLLARIEGVVNGRERAVDFPMTRADCGGARESE
jgi:hypothetical protein